MITVVTFLWAKSVNGYQLPSMDVMPQGYGPAHVQRLRSMVRRHYPRPHRFVCVSDRPIDGVETVPLWPDFAELGGCYRRLKLYDPAIRELLGPRFAVLDLDVVAVGDLTPIFERPEPIVLNAYNSTRPHRDPDQYYNGALTLMDAGARPQVWRDFCPRTSPAQVAASHRRRECIGTDQAWVKLTLGKGEARFTNADGVYEYLQIRDGLPKDARLVMFAGPRDPSTMMNVPWVREHWA